MLLAVGALNVLVDPFYRWSTGLLSPYPTEPAVKLAAVDRGVSAEVVVIGDSRGLGADPVRLNALTSRTAYNAATSASGVAEQVEVADRVLAASRPAPSRAVIWVLAPETFRKVPGRTEDVRLAFSLGELKRSLQRVGMEVGVHRPDLLYRYDAATGRQVQRRPAVGFFDRGEARARRLVREEIAVYTTRARQAAIRRAEPRRRVASALRRWRSEGVAVTVVVPPWHPLAFEEDADLPELDERFRRLVGVIAAREGAAFVDASRIASFGGEEGQFLDGVHMRSANEARFTTLIASRMRRAL